MNGPTSGLNSVGGPLSLSRMRRPRPFPAGLAVLGLLALLTGGCDWLAKPAGDPRREGNYQDGLRWVDQGRPENARESFYHALEANPQNLHAHLALGDLYRSSRTNQALAYFHYSRYLEIGRLLNRGEFHDQSAIDGRRNAEIELARTFAERMFRDQQQFELDGLRRTNALLLERIDVLNRQVAMLTQRVVAGTNAAVAGSGAPPPVGTGPGAGTTGPAATNHAPPAFAPAQPPRGPTKKTEAEATPPTRAHRVQSGETLAIIARRYGVRLAALQAANPGVNPRALKAGQSLVIPSH